MARPVIDATAASQAYARAFRHLAQLPGFDERTILRSEVGIFLKTWAGETKVATQAKTDTRSRLALLRRLELTGGHGVTVNAGVKGAFGAVHLRTSTGKWRRTHDPVFRPVAGMTGKKDHYWDHDWWLLRDAIAQVKTGLPAALQAGRGAVGLNRQSVVQIADSLHIDLGSVAGGRLSGQGLAKARAALASNGRAYRNGIGTLTGDQVRAYAQLVNTLPYNTKIGMDRTAANILQRRASYIVRAHRLGVFESAAGVARAFPNLLAVRAAFNS